MIELLDGLFTGFVVHFDIATTHRTTRFIVYDDPGGNYLAKLEKELEELVSSRFSVEVTNKYIHRSGFYCIQWHGEKGSGDEMLKLVQYYISA